MMKLNTYVKCIYYNFLSTFYIFLNMIFPYYSEEIIELQTKSIKNIETLLDDNSVCKKRKRFHCFLDKLIEKNNDIIEKIKEQEESDNNIQNYEKVDNEKWKFEEDSEQSTEDSDNSTIEEQQSIESSNENLEEQEHSDESENSSNENDETTEQDTISVYEDKKNN